MTIPLKDIPDAFSAGWTSDDPEPFLALFGDGQDVTLTDHGAQLTIPRPWLRGHHQNWRKCHQDFTVTVDRRYPVYWADVDEARSRAKVSFRTANRGLFKNDLPRCKASGKPFHFTAVIDLVIEDGNIVKADEFLRIPFADSVAPDEYMEISDHTWRQVMRADAMEQSKTVPPLAGNPAVADG